MRFPRLVAALLYLGERFPILGLSAFSVNGEGINRLELTSKNQNDMNRANNICPV